MQTFVIDATTFYKGERSEEFSFDGGFGFQSNLYNPIYKRGMIYGMDNTPTEIENDLGSTIACSYIDEKLSGDDLVVVTEDETLYLFKDEAIRTSTSFSAMTGSISQGTSDVVVFKGDVYITGTTQIVRMSGTDYSTVDAVWWTTTRGKGSLESSYRHHMTIVEGIIYVADKDHIHLIESSTVVQEDAMTLPGQCNITTMVKHPDGRHLIAFTAGTANFSGQQNTNSIAYVIDTVSLQFVQEIPISDQVTAAIVKNGSVYVRYGEYGQMFGSFSDDGITPIRKLTEETDAGMGYKHSMKHFVNGHIMISTPDKVWGYGDLGGGENAFWTIYQDRPDGLYYADFLGDKKVMIQTDPEGSTKPVIYIDFDTIGTGMNFYTGKLSLPANVAIRKVLFEHAEYSGSGTLAADVRWVDTAGDDASFGSIDYDDTGDVSRQYVIFVNRFVDTYVEMLIQGANGNLGISKIIIYYEPID